MSAKAPLNLNKLVENTSVIVRHLRTSIVKRRRYRFLVDQNHMDFKYLEYLNSRLEVKGIKAEEKIKK
jgi:hypothetical protein